MRPDGQFRQREKTCPASRPINRLQVVFGWDDDRDLSCRFISASILIAFPFGASNFETKIDELLTDVSFPVQNGGRSQGEN